MIQVQCCVCQRFRRDGKWSAAPETAAKPHNLSHTYCPDCACQVFPKLLAHIAEHVPLIEGLLGAKL